MGERKQKRKDDESKRRKNYSGGGKRMKNGQSSNSKTLISSSQNDDVKRKKKGGNNKRRKPWTKGPRLPNALAKELNQKLNPNSDDDEDIDSDEAANDVYEYEDDGVAEEETGRNRRYDPVEQSEFELFKQFKDEDEDEEVESDDDDEDEVDGRRQHEGDDVEEDDGGRHSRMLQDITGLPSDAFQVKKRKSDDVIFEAYPEHEYNPSRDVLEGEGLVNLNDLLKPLQRKPGFSKFIKSMEQVDNKSNLVEAPLPRPDQEKTNRKAAYYVMNKDITKWEPLLKRNREAPTVYFEEDVDLGYSTIGAIASEFKPRSDLEKKIASLVNNNEIAEAHSKDGARLLELNKLSVEDVKDRQNRLAKMRYLLFRHEMKAKRIKKIKSKTFHRLSKKDRLKAAAFGNEMDPNAAAIKQEFERAKERMTLKHKNTSKWAKRSIIRGLRDEGTRAAISEQLHQNALLTRKIKSVNDGSSDDDSSEEEDDDDDLDRDNLAGSGEEGALKLLKKAKEKTSKLLADDDQVPKSGVLSLPFMARGLKKRQEAADEEAKLAIQEYESSMMQLGENSKIRSSDMVPGSGKRVFGAPKNQIQESRKGSMSKSGTDNYFDNTDSDEDLQSQEDIEAQHSKANEARKDVDIDPNILREESEIVHDPIFQGLENPGTKTTYEVAAFVSNSWEKKKNMKEDIEHMENKKESNLEKPSRVVVPAFADQQIKEHDNDSGTDSDEDMVDGIISCGAKYELPSQADLIRSAFAGDDVEQEFDKDKNEVLNEEYPEPEKPVMLPGWGQWAHIQRKKGLPPHMLEQHAKAKKKREEALKQRKDADLKHVIISEKLDKKAEKFLTKTLPYPYTSNDVFHRSIRMPIGPEFNPATVVGELNRPEVVKQAGLKIKPIQYEDINPHESSMKHMDGGQKQKSKDRGKAMRGKNNTRAVKVKC